MKRAFPMITSYYRNLNQPQKAIDFWMENKEIYRYGLSVPLLTSLAAAYCDVKDTKTQSTAPTSTVIAKSSWFPLILSTTRTVLPTS